MRILLTYQLVTTEIWKEASVSNLDLFDPNYFIAVFIGEIYVLGFTLAIKLGIDYVSSVKREKELENKKMEAELSFLRSQIQPHFFFNTLNNLYALTLIQSKKAPETILKLSEVMSYVIYEGKSKRVDLFKEIKHINDYLDLEKLRYTDKIEATLEITGNLEGYFMPPLILVAFIENCFKHGNTHSDKIPILISVNVANQRLKYSVKNEIKSQKEEVSKKDIRSGIGLKNVKRRLDLLFKNDYNLRIQQDQKTFAVTLNMPLYDQMLNS
jgi:LytS/YehU family sensor histidine kinase